MLKTKFSLGGTSRKLLGSPSSPEASAEKDDKKAATKGQLKDLQKNLDDKIQGISNEVHELKMKLEEELRSTKAHVDYHHSATKEELLAEINQTKASHHKLEDAHGEQFATLKQQKASLDTRLLRAESAEKDLLDQVRRMEQQINVVTESTARDKTQVEYNELLDTLEQAVSEAERNIQEAQQKAEEQRNQQSGWFFKEKAEVDKKDWEAAVGAAAKAYNEVTVFWKYLSRREALDAVTGNKRFDLENRLNLQKRCVALQLSEVSLPKEEMSIFAEGVVMEPDPPGTCIGGGPKQLAPPRSFELQPPSQLDDSSSTRSSIRISSVEVSAAES